MSTKITSRGTLDAGSLGRLPCKEGATINHGNLEREPVLGDDGVLGFSESFKGAPFIKVAIIHAEKTDEDALKNFVGETITYTTNTGKVYTLKDAFTSNSLELAVKDGQLEVNFFGTKLI